LEEDFEKLNKILNQLRPLLDEKIKPKINPNHNSRKSFEFSKEHKNNKPLRIIISGTNSLTSNVEKNFLQPIVLAILNRMLNFC
jgi:hypothetical protein